MKKLILVLVLMLVGCKDGYMNINTTELKDYLNDEYTLLDVRTMDEYRQAHIAGFVNLDYYEFSGDTSMLDVIPKDKPVVIICRSGNRSAKSADILSDLGYEVINVEGGMNAWSGDTV